MQRRAAYSGIAMNEVTAERTGNPDTAKVIYVLYLVGLVNGITILIGLVMAYIYRDDAPDWLRTHYTAQIRMFWIGLLYSAIAGVLLIALIGFALYVIIAVWWIIRCIKGFQQLEKKGPYQNYESWGF
jgi:uncharacterized membrane protein